LNHRLVKSYQAFTAKDWPAVRSAESTASRTISTGPAAAPGPSGPPIGQFLSGLADANMSILIRALLDAQTRAGAAPALPAGAGEPADDDPAGLSAGPEAFAFAQERLGALREEAAVKFLEFRERWRKRLAYPQLQPFLQRNQWFARTDEGWALAGKGTRKDAKMLYLQSLHDMASDGERQVSFLCGHVFRQEGEVAALWHRESVRDNRSRLLPALEAALRGGESALFKRLRLSLGDLAQETFVERVGKWDRRLYASEEELFRQAAWPWLAAGTAGSAGAFGYTSGFEGYMEAFADLCEALCAAVLNHYEAKWGLYLRGLALERG
jgi:hypothetical protein